MNNSNFFPSSNFSGMEYNNNADLNNRNNYFMSNEANEDYVDNILKLNIGKKAKIYITIPGSKDNIDRVFEGIIEKVGKDYIIVSNPTSGEWSLILLPYLTFISFDENINYK